MMMKGGVSELRSTKNVVVLVDNKVRDLNVAALIAHQLRALDVACHLEPLEAYRAVLGAYRPDLVVFNHLTASHLVAWSKRLADMGVLTAVLPNEGILYDPGVLQFNAGRHHNGAHIDYFFCWNEAHRHALVSNGFGERTHVKTIGVPRFDFYFQPWRRIVHQRSSEARSRPLILVCTNFTTAKFRDLPRVHGDRFFAPWAERIPLYRDYWSAIEAHWRSRQRILDYLRSLVALDRYDIVLRPHPSEDGSFYLKWLDTLPDAQRSNIHFDPTSNITRLILDCDLEISCETCTTALESWIADKPTIELIFERHPLWYREVQARANIECDDPMKLAGLVDQQLTALEQAAKAETRRKHLAEWCNSPDGRSAERMARIIAEAVHKKQPADWSKLTANDYRRAWRLRWMRELGFPYQFDAALPLKRMLFPGRYAIRDAAYRKSIRPADVENARAHIERVAEEASNGLRPAA